MTDNQTLTIWITGPQGGGKTQLAEWLLKNLPEFSIREPFQEESQLITPVVIELDNAARINAPEFSIVIHS